MTGRLVTLVVCDRAGEILGEMPPFRVETPWWQDAEPIVRRFGSLQVLRLLSARPSPGEVMGGEVRYLAETHDGGRGLRPAAAGEVVEDHPLRMPWARPGGPAADLEWATGIVEPSGPPVQHRTWNLASIWSIPAGRGNVWLKCVPGFFRHEAAVLQALRGSPAPELLGADAHRMLLAELPGTDGYAADAVEQRRLVDELVQLQVGTVGATSGLLAAGVPDARWPVLVEQLSAVVSRRAPEDRPLQALIGDAGRRTDAIDACGFADVLVHGDAHAGNARIGADPPIWFDWGDSRVGHPLLDLAVLSRLGRTRRDLLRRHWLEAWERAMPGADASRAWSLVEPLATLRAAAVYQGFLDSIEPSERIYHDGDVMPALEAASRLPSTSPGP
jgi:hypothetical protein